ncbi:gamma-glutamyltransferase [Algoriphagus machipongonensis]|uniref:Glutathione hydrolase proenzyme n=1 Tax=Algoriphagus machipongonensis TaxID=388413 RepID=A3HV61_9BACT|nr:gamma-glutamyltransferase [Algoriphagus machipongonensis]EAZ82033.1 gamma-glutamyltransferase [Algoriphagus machipongonensis]
MKRTYYNLIFILAFLFLANPANSQTYGQNGMVVSDHYLASEVGVEILKKGGNAIDAAVATAFALAVTHPEAGNIGGGGFIVFHKENGEVTTFDFREKAPLAASPTMFLDENGRIKDNSNHQGLLSVGVPGTVAGLYQAHQKYGKLSWSELVKPSVELAKKGFTMSWGLYRAALRMTDRDPSEDIMQNFFKGDDGEVVKPGNTWKQPALAKTLKEIQKHGRDGFYKGWVAEEIEAYMKANGGIITQEDLAKYEAVERNPVTTTFNEFEIFSMPPPSSGGVALIEMMNLMEAADISSVEFNSTAYVHLVAEAMRRAFADRAEFLGDPDFNPEMPVGKLTSKEFAKTRFENLDLSKASVSDSSKYGQLYGGDHTTHFSVVDKEGNAISMTYTLENSYGVKMGSSKLGFIFNNEMGDFNPIPGVTTSTGLIGSNPNLVAPEKRMLSSMTPTIVSKDGKPYLIIGSPGGRTIINTVFQTVLNVLAYDMRIDRAIEAMKIHHQWLPDRIIYEHNLLSPDTRKALEKMGHNLRPTTNLGVLMGITYDPELGTWVGAADSSSEDGGARGY